MAIPDKILTWDDCKVCNDLKDKGMCKKEECIDISSSEGQKIAKKLKIDSVPQAVCKDSKGILKKCNMDSIFKKYS